MTRLQWARNQSFGQGLDRGVLYLPNGTAVPWNGLISVDESTVEEIDTTRYFDGVRYVVTHSSGEFVADLSAYAYPPQLDEVSTFGMSYRVGALVHLVYNATVQPSSRSRKTLSEAVEPSTFDWELQADPVDIPGAAPSAHLVIDTEATDPSVAAALEDLLYGSATQSPMFPTVQQLLDLYVSAATLVITDHGDGTWSATGPASMVQLLDETTFVISSPSADFVRENAVASDSYGIAAARSESTETDTTYVIHSY